MREPIVVEHKRSDARRARLLACAFNVGRHCPICHSSHAVVADNIVRNRCHSPRRAGWTHSVHLAPHQEIMSTERLETPAYTPLLCARPHAPDLMSSLACVGHLDLLFACDPLRTVP